VLGCTIFYDTPVSKMVKIMVWHELVAQRDIGAYYYDTTRRMRVLILAACTSDNFLIMSLIYRFCP
jgi:hypothetical protein